MRSNNASATITPRHDFKALSVIAWYSAYADLVGDYMPYREETVIPRRNRSEEWDEYKYQRNPDECADYSYFCSVIRTAPEVKHIHHARVCLNFQKCTTCVDNNAAVASAIATGLV